MNKLTTTLGDMFTEITAMFDKLNEKVLNLESGVSELKQETVVYKQEINILKKRQMNNDRYLLIRELFTNAKDHLINAFRQVKLPYSYLDPIYNINVNIQNLQTTNSFLSYIIGKVADQLGLTMAELIGFLRVKQNSNATFHLTSDIKEYAQRHVIDKKYDLSKFIEEEDLLINVQVIEMEKLNSVFEILCQIYNGESFDNQQNQFKVNDNVNVVYDDGMLYEGILMKYDLVSNEWKIRYNDRRYGSDWTITASRIFKV